MHNLALSARSAWLAGSRPAPGRAQAWGDRPSDRRQGSPWKGQLGRCRARSMFRLRDKQPDALPCLTIVDQVPATRRAITVRDRL
jgi:hypothetical protein